MLIKKSVSPVAPPGISKEGTGEVEIAQNEMTLLTCMLSYGYPQPTVQWFKNGQPLVEVPGRVHIIDNGQSVVSLFNFPLDLVLVEIKLAHENII